VLEDAARAVLDAALDGVDVSELRQPVSRILTSGGAAASILEIAKGAELVVVGSRGRGGFGALLLGSVSQQVAHHATCPVVIVPSDS
jgi:nucleotide-binding universal stress UspA family protein